MLEHLPADLIVFTVTLMAFLVVGLPLITRHVFMPSRVEFETVADHELSPGQSEFFGRLDAELRALNYQPAGNRRPTNMQGQALLRLYLNAADPAIITMNLITSEMPVGDEQSANYLEIVTRYRDGSILSTRNAEISDVLERLPDDILVERRGLRDATRLKRAHDDRAAALLAREPIHMKAEEFEEVFNEHHQRWCRHLLDRGKLRRDRNDPETLRPTIRTGLRGILNYVNPLADNFTPMRFLIGVVFGLMAPAVGLLWLTGPAAPAVARIAATLGLDGDMGTVVAFAVLFGLSGAVVGLVFVEKSLIWSFTFTYVLLRFVSPTGFLATLLLCMWSGVAADQVSRRCQKRRRMV